MGPDANPEGERGANDKTPNLGTSTGLHWLSGLATTPLDGMRNVTEWAKQQACWHRVMGRQVSWPDAVDTELVSSSERDEVKRTAVKDQGMLNGIEAQMVVVRAGSALWSDIEVWGMSKGLLSATDQGTLDATISIPDKVPSEEHSIRTIEILQRLHEEGCRLGTEVI